MAEVLDVIFDQNGEASLCFLENGRIVDFDGRDIGFLDSGNVYNYQPRHCGRYEGGILIDHSGKCVGFGEEVTELADSADWLLDTPGVRYPELPPRISKPFRGQLRIELPRPSAEYIIRITARSSVLPRKLPLWSDYTPISLFRSDGAEMLVRREEEEKRTGLRRLLKWSRQR